MMALTDKTTDIERNCCTTVLSISASDVYILYSPSQCELRVWLRAKNEPEGAPSEFDKMLQRLGRHHEEAHLATFPQVVNLQAVSFDERYERTKALIDSAAKVLYQPLLRCSVNIGGIACEVIGEPDFLILEEGKHVIRDVKLVRRVDKEHHPEALLQVQLYSWIYERIFGSPPRRLEILNGTDELVLVPEDRENVMAHLHRIVELKTMRYAPYSPVGWNKCLGCGFHDLCWTKAKETNDMALIYGVDQGLAVELHDRGVRTVEDLVAQFDEVTLAEVMRPWGGQMRRVGKSANGIRRSARALLSNSEIIISRPAIPKHDNFVILDLEGLPPMMDELGRTYLWGAQVYGKAPGEFQPVVAGFGPGGDYKCWKDFLIIAEGIFRKYGDISWIHWASYERTQLNEYIDRFGDPDGIAARVLKNLFDLLPIVRESVVLPVSSYSLKVVEQYVGFRRAQHEYGGSWSMAKFIEATETEDEKLRNDVMKQILLYNEEDLAATWLVFEFVRWLSSANIEAEIDLSANYAGPLV